jgi:D-inositol-3-phosphate glycosyltransferase
VKVAIIEPVGGHGGMDYYDYGLAMGLAKSGCEVTLHSSSNTVTRDFENVITKHTFGTIWQRSKLLKGALFFLGYIKSLFSSKTGKCDVVHLHFFNLEPRNFSALFLAKRIFRHNVVVTIHDVDSFKDSILTMDSAFGMMDQIIVHNEFSKKELLSKGVDESKIHVIPHGNYLPFIEECLHEPMVQRDLQKKGKGRKRNQEKAEKEK